MQNPHMPDIPMNRDITYFARTNFRGGNQIFGIKRKDRRQHMYVLGKSGTGKSVLLSNLIVQNIWNGEGVCVVDPHGELVETVLRMIPEHRIKDVVYFNPADTDFNVGFNPIELRDPKYKHLVASGLMGIFTKIWANAWSSRMEYILNNTILALLDTPNTTLLGITRMLVDKDYRQVIINNLRDPMVKAFWIHEYEQWKDQFRNEAIAPIQNKVGQFLSTSIIRNIVGQQESTIDIFNIMNEGKIFLVNVSKGRIGEDNSALLGAMIITKVQLAAMERVRIPEDERRDFYLYVDEFQNFATDSFAGILSEARKYRLCLTIAHQYTAQLQTGDKKDLKDAVLGNVGSMIIFRVGSDDAKTLENEFLPEFTPEDLVSLPNYEVYLKLMIDGVTSRPFSALTLPPIRVSSDFDSTNTVIEASRKAYNRPRAEVEASINMWSSTSGGLVVEQGSRDKEPIQTSTSGSVAQPKLYPAICINCEKNINVPFEPIAGKPIYCKDCLNKIKLGEIKPEKGFYDKNASQGPKPAESLAFLGIEFKNENPNPVPIKKFTPIDTAPTNNIQKPVFNTAKTVLPTKMTPAHNNPKPITNTPTPKPPLPPIRDEADGKDKEGFTSLKSLLGSITTEGKTPEKPKQDEAPHIPLIKNEENKTQTVPIANNTKPITSIPTTKAATFDTQAILRSAVENINKKPEEPVKKIEPIVASQIPAQQPELKEIVIPKIEIIKPIPKTAETKPIETTTNTEKVEEPAPSVTNNPKPQPAPLQKRTPKAEVPEDVLKKIFE